MWWKVNRCTENSLHYWMTSLYSLLTSYMSNAHASEGRTTRNVWHSRLRDNYHQFHTLFVLIFVVKGQGTQEEVYTLQYELILILIRMIFKHCEHNFFWRVFTGIPLLFFLTAPSHFYTHTHTPHTFSPSPSSFSAFHTFSPPSPPAMDMKYFVYPNLSSIMDIKNNCVNCRYSDWQHVSII